MKNFSQTNEQDIVLEYLKDKKGVFADFGAGDGVTLSNTHALALLGWSGILVEPSPEAYKRLWDLYKKNVLIELFNCAVSTENGKAKFYHSGEHLGKGDISLLSSLKKEEIKRWERSGEKFKEIEVETLTVEKLLNQSAFTTIDFISIDCEGMDIEILKQLPLDKLQTKCICIEHNGVAEVLQEIKSICFSFGLTKQLLINAENIILAHEQ
jgi:FkbM family methyltransferase